MATDGVSSVIMSSGGGSAAEPKEETLHLDHHVELERLKKECSGMINTLKALHDEEQRLREGNYILAQQAVLMGCTAGLDSGARRGAGRGRVKRPASASSNDSAAKKAAVAKPSNNNNTKTQASPGPAVNVQGIPSPSKAPLSVTVTKDPQSIKEKCEQILKVIYRHGIFTNLTHPARIAEGFVDLTIHMRVIQKKIDSNAFATSFDLFKVDVRNMFDTCLQGSKDGGLFHEVIKELKKSYEFALANID